jgi:DNA-binding CsgD family transcriptional regulator
MASEGLETNEIAEILHISPNTVKVHREHALRRLQVHNMTHAVAELLRRGEIL